MSPSEAAASSIEIREVDLSDSDHQAGLLDLINDYSLTEFGNGRPLDPLVLARLIDGLTTCGNYRGFLAFNGVTPVGLANCFTGYSTFRAQTLLNVHDLCVHHRWRGNGIGRKLLSAVSDYALKQGFCRVTLEVRSDNHVAKRLYGSLGFVSGVPDGMSMEFLTKSLPESSL